MRYRTLALVAVSGLLLAADKAEDANKKALEKLQGTWKVVSATKEGEPAPKEFVDKLRLVVEGNKFTLKTGADRDTAGFVTLDSSKKPALYNLALKEGDLPSALGIYELEGDNLKLCWTIGAERPKAFETKKDSQSMCFVLKREKK